MEGLAEGFLVFEKAFRLLLLVCIVSVPLGLWKLVEIVIWVARHLKWQ